jgi:hypothetical protein
VNSYKRLLDTLILLKLIFQSEEALQNGRWLSQAQMEEKLRERLTITTLTNL